MGRKAASGNTESRNRKVKGAGVSGSFLPSPSACSLRPRFFMPLVFASRFPPSGFRFQPFSFLPLTQMSESSSATARSLLPGFSISYSTRSQSSNVRWVCCWRDVISIRRRTKWGRRFFTCDRVNLWADPLTPVNPHIVIFLGLPPSLRPAGPPEPPPLANAPAPGQNRQNTAKTCRWTAPTAVRQHAARMSATRNQFSLTRAAAMKERRVSKQDFAFLTLAR